VKKGKLVGAVFSVGEKETGGVCLQALIFVANWRRVNGKLA